MNWLWVLTGNFVELVLVRTFNTREVCNWVPNSNEGTQ